MRRLDLLLLLLAALMLDDLTTMFVDSLHGDSDYQHAQLTCIWRVQKTLVEAIRNIVKGTVAVKEWIIRAPSLYRHSVDSPRKKSQAVRYLRGTF